MRLPRWTHRLYAFMAGYFWLPCPLCVVTLPPYSPVVKRAFDVPRAVISTPSAVKLLRHFTRCRMAAGLPIQHGRMKQYRDAMRCLERHLWREEGLLP